MQSPEKIKKCYDATAESYAATRIDELSNKPLDQMLLHEFARLNRDKGPCADFGCGPGHTTRFLYDAGVSDITGIDISSSMVNVARKSFPINKFETGDLLRLHYDDSVFGSALAFYAIVHFDYDQLAIAFREVHRVLRKDAQFLFSFHVGEEIVHFDEANGIDIDIDLHFLETNRVLEILHKSNFITRETIERLPYPEVEYKTKRAYIWAQKS